MRQSELNNNSRLGGAERVDALTSHRIDMVCLAILVIHGSFSLLVSSVV